MVSGLFLSWAGVGWKTAFSGAQVPTPAPQGTVPFFLSPGIPSSFYALLRRLSTPVFYFLVSQFPFLPLPWCPSCPHFIPEGSVSPPSCLGGPPHFPSHVVCSQGGLVADSGLESGHSDLSQDDPRAVPDGENSPSLPGAGVFGGGQWVSNLGHFLTLPCPVICQQTASPSQRPTTPCPECLSCTCSHGTTQLSFLVPLRQPWRWRGAASRDG